MRLEELKLDGEYLKDITVSELGVLPFSLCSYKDGLAILAHIETDDEWIMTLAIPMDLAKELLVPNITMGEIVKHPKVVYDMVRVEEPEESQMN